MTLMLDEIYQVLHLPVVVSAGIHYDGISKEQITQMIDVADELLKELLEDL